MLIGQQTKEPILVLSIKDQGVCARARVRACVRHVVLNRHFHQSKDIKNPNNY